MKSKVLNVLEAIDVNMKRIGEHSPIQPSLPSTPVSRRALKMVMHHVDRRDGANTVSHYDTPVA